MSQAKELLQYLESSKLTEVDEFDAASQKRISQLKTKYPKVYRGAMDGGDLEGGLNSVSLMKVSDGTQFLFLETPGHGWIYDLDGEIAGEEDGGFDGDFAKYNSERKQVFGSMKTIIESSGEFVLTNSKGWFWSGSKFVEEYPDAKVFSSDTDAKKAAKGISASYGMLFVTKDYGSASEKEVANIPTTGRNEAAKPSAYDRHMSAGQEATKPIWDKINALKAKMDPIMDKQHKIYVKYNGEDGSDVHPSDFEKADADAYHKLDQERVKLRDEIQALSDQRKKISKDAEDKALKANRTASKQAFGRKNPHLVKRR